MGVGIVRLSRWFALDEQKSKYGREEGEVAAIAFAEALESLSHAVRMEKGKVEVPSQVGVQVEKAFLDLRVRVEVK